MVKGKPFSAVTALAWRRRDQVVVHAYDAQRDCDPKPLAATELMTVFPKLAPGPVQLGSNGAAYGASDGKRLSLTMVHDASGEIVRLPDATMKGRIRVHITVDESTTVDGETDFTLCSRSRLPMVKLPGATYQMGSDDGEANERPVHPVVVRPFELDVTEVTVAAYGACVNAGKCTTTGLDDRDAKDRPEPHCNWGKSDRLDHPINCVDWSQADAYCQWADKRLPTEQEWEYAARGTDRRKYPWGDDAPDDQLCWKRNVEGTCGVGSFSDPRYDLDDVAGNVEEWTSSAFCPYPKETCADARRVVRGGSWNSFGPDSERAGYRTKHEPTYRGFDVGFRCAR
jgi:formylglycine-generating enzyme required for sulfatase activity